MNNPMERKKKSHNILVVEDNDTSFLLLKELMSDTSVELTHAVNGNSALNMLRCNPLKYDMAIVDIQLPDIDGFEVTRFIKSTHPALPVIAVTASYQPYMQQECLSDGFNEFFTKPYNTSELKETLMQYLN
jgi:two-component system, sensor histidine kinase and response regulator